MALDIAKNFVQEHRREVRISVVFGIFNVILPLVVVCWFFSRATDVRHPIWYFSQPRNEVQPWLMFFVFTLLLVAVSLLQIKYFKIEKSEVSTYFRPCAIAFILVTVNLLVPAWFFGWALQDFADRGLGIFADAPNPNNHARAMFRLLFASIVTALIFFTEIAAVRAYLSRV